MNGMLHLVTTKSVALRVTARIPSHFELLPGKTRVAALPSQYALLKATTNFSKLLPVLQV